MIYSFQPTHDTELVRSIITIPKIYEASRDDFSPAPEKFFPPMKPDLTYVHVIGEAWDSRGLFCLQAHSAIRWEVHTCLIPPWGPWTIEAGTQFLEWLWRNTPCRRLITSVPEYNRAAKCFAEKCGLELWGVDPKAFMKSGKLHDVITLGISKPEVSECPS